MVVVNAAASGNVVVELPAHMWLLPQEDLDWVRDYAPYEAFIGGGWHDGSYWFVTSMGRLASIPMTGFGARPDQVPDIVVSTLGFKTVKLNVGQDCLTTFSIDEIFGHPDVVVHGSHT